MSDLLTELSDASPPASPPGETALARAFAFRAPLTRRARIVISIASCAVVLAVWQGFAQFGYVNPVFLPSPIRVFSTLWTMTLKGQILGNAAISIWRILAAFGLSAVMALPIGMLMASYKPINAALEPIIDFIRYLPTPALVPISIIWFGVGEETKIFLLWLGTFFQLVLLVVDDVNRVPQEYVETAMTLGAPQLAILTDVAWPAILPSLTDNLRITLGWCWTYLIIAEIVAANSGLGFVIWTARRYMQTDQVMAGVMTIGLIGLASDQALRLLHRKMFAYMH